MTDVALFKQLIQWELKDYAEMLGLKSVWQLKQTIGKKDPKELLDYCRVTSFHSIFNGKPLTKMLDAYYEDMDNEFKKQDIHNAERRESQSDI
jgi:hypothetical protein